MALFAPARDDGSVDPVVALEIRRRLGIDDGDLPGRLISGAGVNQGTFEEQQKDLTLFDYGDGPGRVSDTPAEAKPDPVAQLEGAGRNVDELNRQLAPDYSHATVSPTGERMGAEYPTRNPELPLTVSPPTDSIVLPTPPAGEADYKRPERNQPMHQLKQQPGESVQSYNRRRRELNLEVLRDSDPTSKVREVAGGVDESAPKMKMGLKDRATAGLRLGAATAGAGARYGGPGAAGAGLAGALIGLISPKLAARLQRHQEIAAARQEVQQDQETEQSDVTNQLRRAQLAAAEELPARRDETEKERQRDDLRLVWQKLTATTGFDPVNNPEHKQLQEQAALLGVPLLATPAPPARGAGSRTGLLAHTKEVADQQGNKYYVDETTGQAIADPKDPTGKTPLYASRVQAPAEPPDLTGIYESQIADLTSRIAADQKEYEMHAGNIDTKERLYEQEAKRRMQDAQAGDRHGDTPAGKRSLKDWIELVRNDDPDYASNGKYNYSERTRDSLKERIKEQQMELRSLESAARTQEGKSRRPSSGGAYAGRSYTSAEVQTWATLRGITVEEATKLLKSEGAVVGGGSRPFVLKTPNNPQGTVIK